jgi:SAM-dependent methyltransferase
MLISRQATNSITYLNPPAVVSMADAWFDYATPDHFWVRHRNAVFDRHFQKIVRSAAQVGEVGCGNGLVLSHLAKAYQKAADGFELNLHSLHLCPKLPGNLYIYDIFQRHPNFVDRYDVLLLMDVLEHIENEVEFLQAVQAHLKPGGWLIIGVPMRPHLYSSYDRAAGHVRRYSVQNLRSVVAQAGFKVTKIAHWGQVYIPILMLRQWLMRGLSDDEVIQRGFAVSPLMNQLMGLLRQGDRLPSFGVTGASAFLLAQKL